VRKTIFDFLLTLSNCVPSVAVALLHYAAGVGTTILAFWLQNLAADTERLPIEVELNDNFSLGTIIVDKML
jgi:hypothetical protein